MFEQTISHIDEVQSNLIATQEGLQTARTARDRLNKDINNAKRRLERKKSNTYPERYAKELIKALKEVGIAKDVMMKEIDDALTLSGTEFRENEAFYKKYLLKVSENKDIYKYITEGNGWATRLNLIIDFKEVAGDLNDYAHGIQVVREKFSKQAPVQGSNRGLHATNWWLDHIYGDAKYNATVEARIDASGTEAPFWELIAFGSVGLASDRGDGSYNPFPARGVNFLETTERQIANQFQRDMFAERDNWLAETDAFQAEINVALEVRNEFSQQIKNLSTDVTKNQRTLAKFGDLAKFVSEEKLAIAAEKLRAGQEFEAVRIELTASGATRRVRPTVAQLQGLLEY